MGMHFFTVFSLSLLLSIFLSLCSAQPNTTSDQGGLVRYTNSLVGRLATTGLSLALSDVYSFNSSYSVQYDEYAMFPRSDGLVFGSYDDLAYQGEHNFADLGEIIVNRSHYIRFVLPYTESGFTLTVTNKIQYDNADDAQFSLKPLDRKLWLTCIALFVLIVVALCKNINFYQRISKSCTIVWSKVRLSFRPKDDNQNALPNPNVDSVVEEIASENDAIIQNPDTTATAAAANQSAHQLQLDNIRVV